MSTRGFDPGRDETGEVFVDPGLAGLDDGEPDTIEDEFARDDAPEQEYEEEGD